MKILEKYIVKESIKPFIISLTILTSLFIIDLLISKLSLMIEKKLSIVAIGEIFLYSLPAMVALTIPMAILFASIMAFGRFSVDNELVAIRSCGINIYSLLMPLITLIVVLAGFMLYFNHSVLPKSNFKFRRLLIEVAQRNPITNIIPGIFNKNENYSKLVIYAKDRTQQELKDIIIYNKGDREVSQTITAKNGTIDLLDGGTSLIANLFDGEIHEKENKNIENYRVIKFQKFNFNLTGSTTRKDVSHNVGDREITTRLMKKRMEKNDSDILENHKLLLSYQNQLKEVKGKTTKKAKNSFKKLSLQIEQTKNKIKHYTKSNLSYEVEIHKKNAIAFACIIFMLLGIPVGLATKTSGIGMAFVFSAFIFIIYHSTLIGGEQLADRGFVSPVIAMWFSNIILGLFSIYLISESSKEVNIFDIQKQRLASLFRKKK